MKYLLIVFANIIGFFFPLISFSQNNYDYKNKNLPIEVRVNDLLKRMTPEEKFWQLFMIAGDKSKQTEDFSNGIFGFQVNTIPTENSQILNYSSDKNILDRIHQLNKIQKYFVDSTRLGIPVIFFDEALHGLVRNSSTSFPQSIGLAATFDKKMMHEVSKAIATECKMSGIRQILSPVVNLGTDVRWGRMEETYGEDPYLVSEMSYEYVKSFEEIGIITTPKHFIANHGDGGKDSYPIHLSQRKLEETYFVPFRKCIEKGKSRSIMTAYNSFNGSPCSANNWLLNNILKDKWKFDGFVISDANATGGANVLHYTSKDYAESGKNSIENGQDVIFQTNYEHFKLFQPHFLDGKINDSVINQSVKRVLKAKFELGLFDYPYISTAIDTISTFISSKKIAKQAALESFVLLQNNHEILPISNKKKIALIGVDADEVRLGGYSGPGREKISIHSALKNSQNLNITYHEGCGRNNQDWVVIPESFFPNGLEANFFNNINLSKPATISRNDKKIDFDWSLLSPDPSINSSFYSAIWEGEILINTIDTGYIGLLGNDGYKLYIDNQLVIDKWKETYFNTTFASKYLEPNKKYHIKLEFKSPLGNSKLKLIWKKINQLDPAQKILEAKKIVSESDMAIVVVGIEEGEFRDRANLKLPGNQEDMILELVRTGKPIVVMISGGSAVNMQRWMDSVDAIAQIWYAGEQGGSAIADILTGKYCPAGRLPFSYPLSEGMLPFNYNHLPTGRGDDYLDESGLPLFPFGFGLSYTTFEYKNLIINKKKFSIGDTVKLQFDLVNIGNFDGDEVVQIYIKDKIASLARPIMELKAFDRFYLPKGISKKVTFLLDPKSFEMLNADNKWVIEPGEFEIMIGSSSRAIQLMDKIEYIAN